MAVVTLNAVPAVSTDVHLIDFGGGATALSFGATVDDVETTGQPNPTEIYAGYKFNTTCVTTFSTVITVETTVSDLNTGAFIDEDDAVYVVASVDGLNGLTPTLVTPGLHGSTAVGSGLANTVMRSKPSQQDTATLTDAGLLRWDITVPSGTALADLRVCVLITANTTAGAPPNELSIIPPTISYDDVTCAAAPLGDPMSFSVATGHTYSPGVVCYALGGPLDCFGRPTNLTDNTPVDISDGAELYTPAAGKRTIMEIVCHIKEIAFDEIRTDEIVLSEGECDEQRIPGELRGYQGEWIRSRFESPDFDELIGVRRNLSAAGALAASQPIEGYTVCACGAGCKRNGFWMLVWRQMLDTSTSGRALLGAGGDPLWEVQLYSSLSVTGGYSKQKTTQQTRREGLNEPTFTVRADRNTAVDWSDLVVPDGAAFVPLFPASLATVDGVAVDLSVSLGSEITRYTEIGPPNAGCSLVAPRWVSFV